MWSAQFDRDEGEARFFQDEIAIKAADILKCSQRRRSEAPDMDDEVFRLFMKACSYTRNPIAQEFRETAEQIVELAPALSNAHSIVAASTALNAMYARISPETRAGLLASAKTNAAKALDINADNGEAYFAIAVSDFRSGNLFASEEAFKNALERNPEFPFSRHIYHIMLSMTGQLNRAEEINRAAVAIDPLSRDQLNFSGFYAMVSGRLDDARRIYTQSANLYESNADAEAGLWLTELYYGDADRAREMMRINDVGPTYTQERIACANVMLDWRDGISDISVQNVNAACRERDHHIDRYRLYAFMGAWDILYENPQAWIFNSRLAFQRLWYPEMEGFRRDPRFMDLMRQLNFTTYWQDGGQLPDFCSLPDLPYNCRDAAPESLQADD